MKKILLVTLLILIGLTATAYARHGSVGIGVQLGEPTGLSGKFWINRSSAFDVTLGWNVVSDWFIIQAGYLYHFPVDVSSGSLALYVGGGGLLGGNANNDGNLYLAGRIPLGIEYIYDPISFYAELDPKVNLLPGTGLGIGGGLGFRFYF